MCRLRLLLRFGVLGVPGSFVAWFSFLLDTKYERVFFLWRNEVCAPKLALSAPVAWLRAAPPRGGQQSGPPAQGRGAGEGEDRGDGGDHSGPAEEVVSGPPLPSVLHEDEDSNHPFFALARSDLGWLLVLLEQVLMPFCMTSEDLLAKAARPFPDGSGIPLFRIFNRLDDLRKSASLALGPQPSTPQQRFRVLSASLSAAAATQAKDVRERRETVVAEVSEELALLNRPSCRRGSSQSRHHAAEGQTTMVDNSPDEDAGPSKQSCVHWQLRLCGGAFRVPLLAQTLLRGTHPVKLRPAVNVAVLGAALGSWTPQYEDAGAGRVVLEIALRVVMDPLEDRESKRCALWTGSWMLRVRYRYEGKKKSLCRDQVKMIRVPGSVSGSVSGSQTARGWAYSPWLAE